MFCKKCGKQLKDGAQFCMNCGTKVVMPGSSVQTREPEVQKPVVQPKSAAQSKPVERVSTPKPVQSGKKTVNLVPWIVVGILVIAVAVMGYFIWSGRSDESAEDDEIIETMQDSVEETEQEPEVSEDEGYVASAEPAEEPEESETTEEPDVVIGTMETYFFDCKVHYAYLCKEYEGYSAGEGKNLLAVDVTVKNTLNEAIEMYDSDFQAQWGDLGNDAFSFPITYDGSEEGMEVLTKEQLPGIYTLEPEESRNGLLIFEVPKGKLELSISYMETFDDGTTGETYFVNFTVDVSSDQYFLPTSSTEYLTMSDLEGFSQDDCRMARNELYARHGRRFDDPNLQAYFDALDWYEGTIDPADFDESVMNEYEFANRDLIIQYEKYMGYR